MKISKKTIAAVLALTLTAGVLAGCDKNNGETSETVSETSATSSETLQQEQTTRAVAEGDVHAIYKLGFELPAEYTLMDSDETHETYMNGLAMIQNSAANYKEDFSELDTLADSICANIAAGNMMKWTDTEFGDPVKTTIAGFDAIYYDFSLIYNTFVPEDENDENSESVKTEVGRAKSRICFFMSDEDVYYIIFETADKDWDTQLPYFETYIKSLYIDKNAVEPEKTADESTAETASADTASEETSAE